MKKLKLMAIGPVALDVIQRDGDPPRAILAAGSTAGNVAARCAQEYELKVICVARLDDSAVSEFVRRDLDGVTLTVPDGKRYPPTLYVQNNRRQGDGTVKHAFVPRCPICRSRLPAMPQITRRHAAALIDEVLSVDVLFVTRWEPGLVALARAAQRAGIFVYFEPNGLPKDAAATRHFAGVAGAATVIKYSHERLRDAPASQAPLTVVTLGSAGLRYSLAGGPWHDQPAPSSNVAVVETAGAGDAMTAALIAALGHLGGALASAPTASIVQALLDGQRAARAACAYEGARGLAVSTGGRQRDSLTLAQVAALICARCRASQRPTQTPEQHDRLGWRCSGRPGYVGGKVAQARRSLDEAHGETGWAIEYAWRGDAISRRAALEHYGEAYRRFLEADPALLDWLVRTASDVYDLEPRDTESGFDWQVQKGRAVHLQDIAVRRAVRDLGRGFSGDELMRIRGQRSKGARLSPGVVPFHRPGDILKPELTGWWKPGSVESFWQSNKLLMVRTPVTVMFGGSFNPITCAHLALARYCRDELGAGRVVFVCNGDAYPKPGLLAAADRHALVQAAIEGEPGFVASDAEVQSKQSIRTPKTLTELCARYPDDQLVLLRGHDTLHRIHHRVFTDSDRVRLLVVTRGDGDVHAAIEANPLLSANRHRIDVDSGFRQPGSASDVRQAIATGASLQDLVPPPVEQLIRHNGWYGADAAEPAATSTLRILVVEDSADRVKFFRSLLREHATVWSTTAARASRLVANYHFDLITLDFDLNGPGDGESVARAIKASANANTPLWVHSMNAPGADRIRLLLPHASVVPFQSLIATNRRVHRLRDALRSGPVVSWSEVFSRRDKHS